MKIVLIGAGNLATHLGRALLGAGHEVVQVYSRTLESATALARRLNTMATNSLEEVQDDAELYVFSVKDSALPLLAESLARRCKGTFVHTAGSIPMSVFPPTVAHCGVLYPMQTFSKKREVDFSEIPCFVEASDVETLSMLHWLCGGLTDTVYDLSSEDRRHLHLAAVFASNFANHCYAIASQILERHGIPFSCMLPLVRETAAKVERMPPREAQTGPAVRYDENVLGAQERLLGDTPRWAELYRMMSRDIHFMAKQHD